MKAIDFRLRPPTPAFLSGSVFSEVERRNKLTVNAGFEVAGSAHERSMPMLLSEMDAAQVESAVVAGRWTGAQTDVPDTAIAELMAAYPGRFIGAASINPVRRKEAFRTIETAVAAGFRLVNIEPGFYPAPMHADDRRLYPIYGLCEDLRIPVLLMAGGTAGPDLSYSDPMCTDRVLADFPHLKVVVAHGGWPWVHEIIHVAFRRPNLYLCPDYYFARMPGWEEYLRAADTFLSRQVVYASCYPNCPVRQYKEWFETLPLQPENMQRVLYDNARELLAP